ncbi:MAG: hydrogenase expression/formation protein HypE [Leptospiraceae bacterium]|nr:hydrogenase expression/formation protein HypE [Leptospiraceae bacterium]
MSADDLNRRSSCNAPEFTCPLPDVGGERIWMAHGGGGRFMHRLLAEEILPATVYVGESGHGPASLHDAARIVSDGAQLAFTTDSYVVRPLFFPGGDIGRLAVYGTVNDLAMAGARPRYLSCALILEEGLEITVLRHVLNSIRLAAAHVGVHVLTGDTKVVERGHGDGIYINTAGIGIIEHELTIAPDAIQPGDAIILSGDIGRHGIAVMSAREGFEFETAIESDCAPLHSAVAALLDAGLDVHCMRDLTRGGLAQAVLELNEQRNLSAELQEDSIPISSPVRAACQVLGYDPLYLANEGRFIAIVPPDAAERTMHTLRALSEPGYEQATLIGHFASMSGPVTIRTPLGSRRVLDMLSGEQLPRIC